MTTLCLLPDSDIERVRALCEGRVRITRRHAIEPLSRVRAAQAQIRVERDVARREAAAFRWEQRLPDVEQPSPRAMGLLDGMALRRRRRNSLSSGTTVAVATATQVDLL